MKSGLICVNCIFIQLRNKNLKCIPCVLSYDLVVCFKIFHSSRISCHWTRSRSLKILELFNRNFQFDHFSAIVWGIAGIHFQNKLYLFHNILVFWPAILISVCVATCIFRVQSGQSNARERAYWYGKPVSLQLVQFGSAFLFHNLYNFYNSWWIFKRWLSTRNFN